MYKNLTPEERRIIEKGTDKDAPKSKPTSLIYLTLILFGFIAIGYLGFMLLNFLLG